jgi:hypothetical protein
MTVTHKRPIPNEYDRHKWATPHNVNITVDELDPALLKMFGTTTNIVGMVSNPPPGCYKVINIYVDPTGKLIVKWSDTPQGA